uniref:Portal protein n=1 Tax=viral metagenome TaxID=1070528 RepID=A0A6H1ZPU8_9ZZZZ
MEEGYRGIFGSDPLKSAAGGLATEGLPGSIDQGQGLDPNQGVDPNLGMGLESGFQDTQVEEPVDQYPRAKIVPITIDENAVLKELNAWYSRDMDSTIRKNFLKNCQDWHSAYLGYMPPTSFPWKDGMNVDLGIIEMATDNIKARFKMSTLGGKPAFAAVPLNIGAEEILNEVQDMMSAGLDQQVDIEKVADLIAQDTVELGNCITKRRWDRQRKNVRYYKNDTTNVNFRAPFMNLFSKPVSRITIEAQEIVDEKPMVEIVQLNKILVPDDGPEDIQKMHHVMHLFDLDENELDELFANDESYDPSKLEGLREFLKKRTADKDAPRGGRDKVQESITKTIKCAEVYCKWKHNDTEFAEEVIFTWAIEAKQIIRAIKLIDIYYDGLRPFRWFRYKSSGNVYGRGVVEMLYPYRTALNTIFNMSVNCMMLQILPWGFYRYGSSFKPEDHKLAPGVWIPLDDINDAKPAQFPPTARLADGAIGLLIQLVERQSGISAPHMGQETTGRKTAFEVKAVISEGNIKHEERIANFQDIFSDLLHDIYNLYKFNMPDNAIFRKLYDQRGILLKKPVFFTVPSRYMMAQYDFDFVIMGTLTTGNKSIEREDAVQLADILMKFPMIAENPDAQHELMRDVITSFGKRNMDKYLLPEPVVQMLKNMKMKELVELAQGKRAVGTPTGRPPAQG